MQIDYHQKNLEIRAAGIFSLILLKTPHFSHKNNKIYWISQEKESSISMEFYENGSYDIEGDYIEQKSKPPTFFEYQGVKKEATNQKNAEKPRFYFVRIPIVVNNQQFDEQNSFPLKFYFYFKSYKTEDFWMKRQTVIYFNKP